MRFKIIIFLIFFSLFGCGDFSEGVPHRGDEIHIGIDMVDFSPDMNLYLESSGSNGLVSQITHSTLFELGIDSKLTPKLVQFYSVNSDGTTWEMILHDNVFFHDEKKLSAEDVVYTFNYIREHADSQFHDLLSSLRSVEVVGDRVVKFSLNEYDEFFFYALQLIPISRNQQYENKFSFKMNGTGAYQFYNYDIDEHILTLTRNNKYFRDGAYLDKVIIHFLPNYLDGLALLQKNEIDFLYLSDPVYEKIFENDKNFNVIFQKKPIYYILDFNPSQHHAFSDVLFRQKINALIPKKRLIEKLQNLSQTIASATLFDKPNQKRTNDNPLPKNINILSYKEHEFSSFIIYQMMQEFYSSGIKLEPTLLPLGHFLKRISSESFDMAIYPADFSFDDYYIYQYLDKKIGVLQESEGLKKNLHKMRHSSDLKERVNALHDIKERFNELLPFIILLQRNIPMVISKRFQGYDMSPVEIMDEIEKMWVNTNDQKYKK